MIQREVQENRCALTCCNAIEQGENPNGSAQVSRDGRVNPVRLLYGANSRL